MRSAWKILLISFFVQLITAEERSFFEKNFNLTFSQSLEDGFEFKVTNNIVDDLFFKFVLENDDSSYYQTGQAVLFQGDEDRQWNIKSKLPMDENMTFRMFGKSIMFSEDLEEDFDFNFNFRTAKGESFEIKYPKEFRSNENIEVFFKNNMDDAFYYNYTLMSEDGAVSINNFNRLDAGQEIIEEIGSIPRDWQYSKNFSFQVNLLDENFNEFHSESYDDFKYMDDTHMFEMKNNFVRDENVTFTFKNFMDVDAVLNIKFYSYNDSNVYNMTQSAMVNQGQTFVVNFGNSEFFMKMMNDLSFESYSLNVTGYFEFPNENVQMQDMVVEEINFGSGDENENDYYFEMSRYVNEGERPMFHIKNKMESDALRLIFYMFGDGQEMYAHGDLNVEPRGSYDHFVDVMEKYRSEENMEKYSFYVVGYNMSDGEEIFYRSVDDFKPYKNMYNVRLSKEIGPGRTFKFEFESSHDNVTIVSWKFESSNGQVFKSGGFSVDKNRDFKMDVFKFPANYQGDKKFSFELIAINSDGEEWKRSYDGFKFMETAMENDSDYYEIEMDDKVRAGENVTFVFMNKRVNRNATANFRFYSADGRVNMMGSFVSSSDRQEVNMGMMDEDYTGSTDFVFEMDVTFYGENEDGDIVNSFNYEKNDFEFETSDYSMMMSSNLQAGEFITFTIKNFMSDEMSLDYKFSSDDFQVDFSGKGKVKAGKQRTFKVGKINRMYKGSENFNFQLDAFNAESGEEMQSRKMNDFDLERGMYAVYMPKMIRPNFDITFSMMSTRNTNNTVFYYEFMSEDKQVHFMDSFIILQGESLNFVVGQIPQGYKGSQKFMFNITGEDMESEEKVFYEETDEFMYEDKSTTILIEANQDSYRAGDMMKFRAVFLTPDLTPVSGDVEYWFMGPNGEIYKQQRSELEYGVMQGEMSLHDNCQDGEWTIRVQYENQVEEMKFEVTKEQAQNFNVYIDSPEYFYNKMEGINLKLSAKYPKGEGVRGSARLQAEIKSTVSRFNRKNRPNVYKKNFNHFEDFEQFFISRRTLRELGWQSWTDLVLELTFSVTDKFNGDTYEDVAVVDLRRSNIKVDVQYRPDIIKPGLSYSANIFVTEQDGKPLRSEDRKNNDLVIDVEYRYPIRGIPKDFKFTKDWADSLTYTKPKSERYVMKIPENGFVNFHMNALSDNFEYASFRVFTNTTSRLYGLSRSSQWIAKPKKSPSRSYIQASMKKSALSVGDKVEMMAHFSKPVTSFRVTVMARGTIQMEFQKNFETANHQFDFDFDTTYQMTPGFQVMVSYFEEDGELVADYCSCTLFKDMIHEVDMEVSDNQFNFDDEMKVQVRTDSMGSFVGVTAKTYDHQDDKHDRQDFSEERIVEDMMKYSRPSSRDQQQEQPWHMWKGARQSMAVDSMESFDDLYLNVMTDVDMKRQNKMSNNRHSEMMYEAKKPRTHKNSNYRRSTWMWENTKSNRDGLANFEMNTPKMMTSSYVRSFVVSQNGFALSKDHNVKVYEDMFMNIDAPMKVTQDEVIIVRATVYNYMKHDLPVNMIMQYEQDSDFELIMLGEDITTSGPVRWVTVPSGGSVEVDYPLRMNTAGSVDVSIMMRSNKGEMSLSRDIYVDFKGDRQCYTYTKEFSREDGNSEMKNLRIKYPENVVEGSESAEMFVYSDLMETVMNNVGNMHKDTDATAEQSMFEFASAIHMYLNSKLYRNNDVENRYNENVENRYMKEITEAMQNLENFRREDGSYSMFGDKDEFGSTWLTAYAVRGHMWMIQQQPDNEWLENKLQKTVEFVLRRQNYTDGGFYEDGNSYNMRYQGNSTEQRMVLTSFVVFAIAESGLWNFTEVQESFYGGIMYLQDNLDAIKDDQYALSHVAYTLQMVQSEKAKQAFDYFKEFMQNNSDNSTVFWTMGDKTNARMSDDYKLPYPHPSAPCVEMTAHGLMLFMAMNETENAVKTARWLGRNRDYMGGYRSSYSTILSVRSMTMMVMYMQDKTTYSNRDFEVSHSDDSEFSENFDIRQDFSMDKTSYRFNVPAKNGQVKVRSSGKGWGFAQMKVCYNVMNIYEQFEYQTFECSLNTKSDDYNSAHVDYCCSLRKSEDRTTGMFVMQIETPNGFTVDVDEQQNKDTHFMQYENNQLNVYFKQLAPEQQVCASVMMERNGKVAKTEMKFVRAFDYFNPARRSMDSYKIKSLNDVDACNVCGMDCSGCKEPQLSDWREFIPCISCEQKFSIWRRVCVDPNTNMRLDQADCYEDEQEERRECNTKDVFPVCPDKHDGLWRVMPEYEDKNFDNEDYDQMCETKPSFMNNYVTSNYENAAKNGIPGTDLEYRQSYMECNMKSAQLGDEGNFSLSLLVYVEKFEEKGSGVIFAYGDEGKPAVFKLWHHSMYGSPIVFRVSLNNFIYTVGPVDGRSLLKKWTHIMVSWNTEKTSFYINGTSVGWSFHFPSRKEQVEPENAKLFIGRDTVNSKKETLNGWVSSLDFWSRTLTDEDVKQVYNFYKPMVEASRDHQEKAVISQENLRYIAPAAYKQCFFSNSSIRDLFTNKQMCDHRN